MEDIINQKFGRLLVISLASKTKRKNARGFVYIYECLCDCGNSTTVSRASLKGGTKSCGCIRGEFYKEKMRQEHNLEGLIFSRLTVLQRNEETFSWMCRCECGNITEASTDYLRSGKKRSCGCLHTEISSAYLEEYKRNYRISLGKNPDELLTPESKIQRERFKDTAKEILYRDNFYCTWCSSRNVKLEVHHIQQWASNPDLRFKHSNLCTLCTNCHKKVHFNGYHSEPDHIMNILLQGYVNLVEEGFFKKEEGWAARTEITPN